jgi:hypothetical protein
MVVTHTAMMALFCFRPTFSKSPNIVVVRIVFPPVTEPNKGLLKQAVLCGLVKHPVIVQGFHLIL